ncbi:helix-turn-helix transcriptional regulator [Zooshikella marina]|uniref:helix-turn-helix domain-containing protein n=1 Tax=Zooshikella ganghwensis TaxID=202772 RepID=UPI001BAEF868|nr:helix-turn-helix transcriptional regulator [Zooshikella ganghwensis]MBU2709178.1 helix-turn-helix transcriptional regulator [Zooshikella ganghwensis]
MVVELWQKIKEARKEAGLTQQQLADIVGVTHSTACRWESEDPEVRRTPQLFTLMRIADATKVPIFEFTQFIEGLGTPERPYVLPEQDSGKVQLWEKIKSARIKANLTQQELADACSVSRTTVVNWESGKRTDKRPRSRTLRRIADVLNVPYSWLSSETEGIPKDWLEENPDIEDSYIEDSIALQAKARNDEAIRILMDSSSYILDHGISQEFFDMLKAFNRGLKRFHD